MKWMKDTYDMSYRVLGLRYGISKSEAYYICNPGVAAVKNERLKLAGNKHRINKRHVESNTKSRKKMKELKEKFKV